MTNALAFQPTLYGITDALATAIDGGIVFDEETGEVLFDSENLDALEIAFTDKVEACGIVAKHAASMADQIRAEEKRLAERRRAYERKEQRLKDYMAGCMERLGQTKVETPRGVVSLRKKPAHVEIIDEDAIPDEYMRVTKSPDKRAISAAVKDGENVPGAALITNEKTLSIK